MPEFIRTAIFVVMTMLCIAFSLQVISSFLELTQSVEQQNSIPAGEPAKKNHSAEEPTEDK